MTAHVADTVGLHRFEGRPRDRVATSARVYREAIHPLHALFLAFTLPLYLTAWLSDLVYKSTFGIQWLNFAQWAMVGALLFGGFALLWSLIALIRAPREGKRRHAVYFVLLLLTFVLGFINELIHAKDAFATMPAGLYMSFIVTVLALVASWMGYSGFQVDEVS